MKVICHIGHPKTATTFLQNTCVANRDWLKQHGILYPDTTDPGGNHIGLVFACANYISAFARERGIHTLEDAHAYRGRLRDHLKQQIAAAGGQVHTILLSSENLTANIHGQDGVQNVADFLSDFGDDIQIVVYLRRQDDSLLSMYGEFMRRGFAAPTFEKFTEDALRDTDMLPHIFYRRILEFWVRSFGRERITVRLFDRARLIGGDILADFLDVVFAGKVPDLSGMKRSPQDNTGLSAPVLEFLRRMQPHIPFDHNGIANPQRRKLQARIEQLPTEPRPRLSKQQSDRIMTHFAPANEWVRSTFLPDLPTPLFPPRPHDDPTSNLGQISIDEFAQFTGMLLK